MSLIRFFLAHPRLLSFGLLSTLFSSFGQTFLIAIFVPRLLETFALDTRSFGLLYAAATLLCAATLPYFGRLLDRTSLRRFSLAVACGLALACLGMAFASNVTGLFVALVGLRLSGQGLLSLTASTTMARAFSTSRGKALSLAGLGYPLGEAILPLLVVHLMQTLGWRTSWAVFGALVALVLVPLMTGLLRDFETRQPALAPVSPATLSNPGRPALFRDRRFYALLPGTLFLPFVLTALFLYQLPLAAHHGWSVELVAAAFGCFAVARIGAALVMGPLIDRFSAKRLFPLILLPVCAGLAMLGTETDAWVAYFYLGMAGISQGLAAPLMTALWAEIYGIETLGAIKSTISACAILATALGPLVLGWMLSAGIDFDVILPAAALLALLASASSFATNRYLGPASG